ncbi:Cysteine-rich receptor-like protein kinase 10, partial [Bienertia sinuspersici]
GILADGREIAVKRLSTISKQGDEEFKNEVLLLAKLQHKSLVRLMGFCLAKNEKILVYEFVSNKSLDCFLFDSGKKGVLIWSIRYNIIRGVARGMLYLHEDCHDRIVHRDLKAANVLLDVEMNPKVADFGLARVCAFEQTHVDTSRVAGTIGYIAPEYMFHGQFSTKSDVYSFGVLILEIISGKRVGDLYRSYAGNLNLLTYVSSFKFIYSSTAFSSYDFGKKNAWTCWLDGKSLELVDPMLLLGDSNSNDNIVKCIHLGLLCVQEEIHKRPSMDIIVQTLKTYYVAAETLPMPQPPYFMSSSSSDLMTTTTKSSSATVSLN